MSDPAISEGAAGGLLLLCDHASAAVPDGIDLGVPPDVMARHVAVDIGAAPLTRALAARLGAPAVLATVSRLVIDLHRQPDHPALIPLESDGDPVPGNHAADRADRVARFHRPYHRAVAAAVRRYSPRLIVAIHSFTPRLRTMEADRPWQIGILYNRDTRAAQRAIAELRSQGLCVGDNEPYTGRRLNATLNRHAEAHGFASFAVEVRNDLIADDAGVARWADRLVPLLGRLTDAFALSRTEGEAIVTGATTKDRSR